ncbi:MAG: ATP-binding protein [Patulibacter sp.]
MAIDERHEERAECGDGSADRGARHRAEAADRSPAVQGTRRRGQPRAADAGRLSRRGFLDQRPRQRDPDRWLGNGKTHFATALGIAACQQGRRVRFTTLAALANELQEAQTSRELARVVGRYARTELVVLDELGYLALPDGAAELVFQVLSKRHERGSLIVTTNLPFGEWTKVFPDARLAKAVVDRLTHRAHIIDTGDESWRFRHGLRNKT